MLGNVEGTQPVGDALTNLAPRAIEPPQGTRPLDKKRDRPKEDNSRKNDTERFSEELESLTNRKVEFELDPDSKNGPIIRLIDEETGEVMREIPEEELRRIGKALRRMRGLLLDRMG